MRNAREIEDITEAPEMVLAVVPSVPAVVSRAVLDAADVEVSVVSTLDDPFASEMAVPPDSNIIGIKRVLLDLSAKGIESAVPLAIVDVTELETAARLSGKGFGAIGAA